MPEAPRPGRGSERLPRRGSCCQSPEPSSSPGFPRSRDSGSAVGAAWGDLSLRCPRTLPRTLTHHARSHTHAHSVSHAPTLAPGSGRGRACPLVAQGAFTRSRYLHLGCVLLCSGGSIGYCVRRTGLCQLSPQRGSHPCLSLSPVLTDAPGRLGTASFSGVSGVVGRGGLRPSQGAPGCPLGAADLPGELAPGRRHGGFASCCRDSGFPPGEKAGLLPPPPLLPRSALP